MQPYFFPYAGYFRLMLNADIFVILDCVQFPRNGWVHRNKFTDQFNKLDWLTLPLTKKPRDLTNIIDLEFRPNFERIIREDLKRFKLFNDPTNKNFLDQVVPNNDNVISYLEETLLSTLGLLQIDIQTVRSSTLGIGNKFKGQDKIIEICKVTGADTYINLNGGRQYYDKETFEKNEIQLKILEPYLGSAASILERIAYEELEEIREELKTSSKFLESLNE
jgi:hypothetical protein